MPHFERVYTVTDYYDGPRSGIADFGGHPHVYRSLYLDRDTWDLDEDRFELSPISTADLELALEDWAIFCRWRDAFDAGRTALDTHPALPEDRARWEEIARLLAHRLGIDPDHRVLVRGAFRVREPVPPLCVGVLRPFEVQWSSVELTAPAG